MKDLEITCDKCNKQIEALTNYEITIMKNPGDDAEPGDDVETISVKVLDLCESCYDKFFILNCDILKSEKE